MKFTIYSTTTCPYCKMLKDYLTERKISFTEKLVDQDDIARDEMAGLSNGFLGVPFSLVETDGGERKTIVGFDKGRLEEILGVGN